MSNGSRRLGIDGVKKFCQAFFSRLACDSMGVPKSSGMAMGRTNDNAGHQARGFIYFGIPYLGNAFSDDKSFTLCFAGAVRAESTSISHTSISGTFTKHSSVISGGRKDMPLLAICNDGEAMDGIRYCQAFAGPASLKIDVSNVVSTITTAIDELSSDLGLDVDATVKSRLGGSYTDPISLSVQKGGD